MNDPLICTDEQRRDAVRRAHRLNGLDYLEVDESQTTLRVYFLGKAPHDLKPGNLRVDGGERIRDIQVTGVELYDESDPEVDDYITVTVDKPGDFSTYVLRVVKAKDGRPTDERLADFDPRYAALEFSFKVDCPSELDCQTAAACPPPDRLPPEINYLAKDYASFRQLILDRLALIMPDWQERHVPDLGIALVEVLAYVADHLSYYQDAVATEAYLGTARQRISVRRHARLVDYRLHEGCNARVFVTVATEEAISFDPHDIFFITRFDETTPEWSVLNHDSQHDDVRNVPPSSFEVFEPVFQESIDFGPDDFKDLGGLVVKLRSSDDTLAKYLRTQFSDETRKLMREYDPTYEPSTTLRHAVIDALNQELYGDDLYSEHRFPTIPQGLQTEARKHPRGEGLVRINRQLLEAAYPDEIESGKTIRLYPAHNTLLFHTWRNRQCCLPKDATAATLKYRWMEDPPAPTQPASTKQHSTTHPQDAQQAGSPPIPPRNRMLHLREGDVLIFEEVIGPQTGNRADADPHRRQAVRLTKVTPSVDPVDQTQIVEIEWGSEDKLRFPFCISTLGPAPACELIENVSIAHGNAILADHGRTLDAPEPLGTVAEVEAPAPCEAERMPAQTAVSPAPFNARLQQGPLTFWAPSILRGASAAALLLQDPREAVPQVWVDGQRLVSWKWKKKPPDKTIDTKTDAAEPIEAVYDRAKWSARPDLLASNHLDAHFVVEVDNDGRAHLRFGDGELGRRPDARTEFTATYRVGNGLAGNVGAEAITHVVSRTFLSGIRLRPRNPLAAVGGTAPEPVPGAKLLAPYTFRAELQRAITADDYARLAERHPKVQRAAATLRWMGSWYEALVAIDPFGQEGADAVLRGAVADLLEPFRRIGHDLRVVPATYVPLRLEMTVSVRSHYLRGHVEAALLDRLSNRVLPDGQRGFFHPDNLSFGEGVFLSKIVGVAQAVTGVENVTVDRFERFYDSSADAKDSGVLTLGPFEIACLDNDASLPENGVLHLTMEGGR